jgi:hypothetical protein
LLSAFIHKSLHKIINITMKGETISTIHHKNQSQKQRKIALTMADRERSRSRSPKGGAPADDANQNGDDQGPPAGDAPPAGGGDAQNGGDDGENPDEVKLYVGNLDYGMLLASVVKGASFVYINLIDVLPSLFYFSH